MRTTWTDAEVIDWLMEALFIKDRYTVEELMYLGQEDPTLPIDPVGCGCCAWWPSQVEYTNEGRVWVS